MPSHPVASSQTTKGDANSGPTHNRLTVQARWLLWLRWFAVAGQFATVLTASWAFQIALPMKPLLLVIVFTIATNLALELWLYLPGGLRRKLRKANTTEAAKSHRLGRRTLAAILALDLASLTILLYFTGGVANPFVVFYFVNVALGAVILPTSWAFALTAAAMACACGLYMSHVPLPALGPSTVLRTQGLLVALAACGLVITYFITRVTRELREREQQLRVAEQQRFRAERLEALATLAAGAGHELASPLSTIAVIAGELQHHLEGADVPDTVLEDVSLIRTELDYCRNILDRMSGHAGEAVGESVEDITVEGLVDEVLEGLRHPERVETKLGAAANRQLRVPLQALAQAMRGVVQNALDASPDGQPVTISVQDSPQEVVIEVTDRGNGMEPAVLQRIGEPFFTTKEPGQGMGLGHFLTRNVLERLGGRIDIESQVGQGSTAIVRLPV